MLALRIVEASVRMSEGNCSKRLQEGSTSETVASASPGVECAEGRQGRQRCVVARRGPGALVARPRRGATIPGQPQPRLPACDGGGRKGSASSRLASSEGEGRRTRSGHDNPRRVRGSRRAVPADRGGIARCRSGTALSLAPLRVLLDRRGDVLTREQQADKPRLVVEVADEVWGGPQLTQRALQHVRCGALCGSRVCARGLRSGMQS